VTLSSTSDAVLAFTSARFELEGFSPSASTSPLTSFGSQTRTTERDVRGLVVQPGYGDTRPVFDGSGGTSGLKSRVGSRNLPLAAFLGAFLGAGLRIESFEELDTQARPWVAEPDDRTIVPWNILLVAAKSEGREGSIAIRYRTSVRAITRYAAFSAARLSAHQGATPPVSGRPQT
jgi:hypothetical protein